MLKICPDVSLAPHVLQKRNPLAHVDTLVDSTPGLRELLTELSEMAVGMAGEMDSRAVPNVLWAMGMLRQNLLGALFHLLAGILIRIPSGCIL